ncbi:MAG: hypothetical protein PHH26_01800, partial [Candidatus Thermoplasmatota archaeon]|nr:hypothetical protein [Candidatus Thermoplasmatota archaeon]
MPGNYFVQGGNAFSTTGTLGLTDNNDLNIRTNNTNRITVLRGGNVGIGTTNPLTAFHVRGSYPFFLLEDTSVPSFLALRGDGNTFFDSLSNYTIASQPNANKGTASGETVRFRIKGSTGNVYASGTMMTGGLTTYGTNRPGTTNLYDLGSSSYYWNHLFARYASTTAVDALGYVSTTRLFTGSGSAGAPSIAFQSDPDSGLYRYGNNVVGLAAGGSSAIRYDSGTLYTNSIYSYSASPVNVVGQAADTASAVGVVLNNVPALTTTGAKLASFRNNSIEKAFIDKDGGAYFGGNVGVGTSNPYLFKLTVAGSVAPSTTNSYDLGASSYYWRNLFVRNVSSTNIDALGYVSTTKLWVNGTQVVTANPNLQQVTDQGYFTTRAIGFAGASSTGSIIPTVTNSYDLGSSSLYWRRLYATNVSSSRIDALTYVSTTKLIAGLGAQTAPTITFQGDPDTGIYSSGANNIDFTTSGVLRMGIDTNLNLAGNFYPWSNNTYNIGASNAYWNRIFVNNVSSTRIDALTYVSSTKLFVGKPDMSKFTFATARIAQGQSGLNSTSNVGLAIEAVADASRGAYGSFSAGMSYGSKFAVGAYGRATVSSSTDTGANYAVYAAANNAHAGINYGLYTYVGNGTKNYSVYSGDGGILYNRDSVGIGTDNPYLFKLTIAGTIAPSTTNSYDLGASSYYWRNLFVKNVSSTNIDAIGYVSTTKLYLAGSQFVPGNYFVQGGNAFAATGTLGTTDNYNLTLKTNNTSRLTILNGGNVGIGTVNPAQKLDVAGNVNIDATSNYMQGGKNILFASSALFNFFGGEDAGRLLKTAAVNGDYNTALGYQALYTATSSQYNTALGFKSLYSNTAGKNNTASGLQSLYFNTAGSYNTANGYRSLYSNTSGNKNSGFGQMTMYYNTTGENNSALGYYAGFNNASATNTTAIGYNAAVGTAKYANQNGVYLGYQAGYSAQTGSDNNTILGYNAGYANTTGANNLFVGYQAGSNVTTGSNNIIIGYYTSTTSPTASNQLNIGNSVYGNLSTGNIGIGLTTPYAFKLTVAGNVGPSSTNAYDLGSSSYYWRKLFVNNVSSTNIDALGYVSTTKLFLAGSQFVPGNYFVQGGNAFAATGTLGTTDNYNLTLKTNNTSRLTILNGGNVGIGTVNPLSTLQVNGDQIIQASTYSSLASLYANQSGRGTIITGNPAQFLLVNTSGANNEKAMMFRNYNNQFVFTRLNDVGSSVLATPFTLDFATNNILMATGVGTLGNVGIGTTNPYLFKLTVAGSVAPSTTNSYDLGGTANYWRKLYVKNVSSTNIDALGYVSTTKLWVNGSQVVTANPNLQQVTDQGYFTTHSIGFAGASSTGSILPTSNNAYDLGSVTKSWQNVYASGTAYLGQAIANYSASGTSDSGVIAAVLTRRADVSGTYSNKALYGRVVSLIKSGVVDTGNLSGVYSYIVRNQAEDQGTIANSYGLSAVVGHYGATSRVSTNVYGARIYPFAQGGTIDNLYGYYMAAIDGAGTVTNKYGVYIADTSAKNYFGGNVGIGTTNPYLYKLTVAGSVAPSTTNSYDLGGTANYWRKLYVKNVSSTNIDALGYVSTTKLYLAGSQFVPGNYFVQGGNSFSATGTLGTNDAYNLALKTNNTNRLVITSAGKVGVGTVNPYEMLDVYGAAGGVRIKSTDATGYSRFYVENNSSGHNFQFLAGGTTRAGTTFGVSNADLMVGYSNNTKLALGTADNYDFTLGTNNAAVMTLKNTGNVGIGTTNPYLYKLTVAGSVAPSTTNSYDLGGTANYWNHLYARYASTTAVDALGYVSSTKLYVGIPDMTKFSYANSRIAQGQTGLNLTSYMGLVVEGAADASRGAYGIAGISKSYTSKFGVGIYGGVTTTAPTDTGAGYAMYAFANVARAGINYGLYSDAGKGTKNYSVYGANGYLYNNDNVGIGVANPYLFKLTVAGSVAPSTTNSYDLGGSANYWRKLFVKNVSSTNIDALGYVSTTKLWVNGTQVVTANPNLQQVTDQGYFTTHSIGFAGASSTGNIIPTVTNSYDLGSSSLYWRRLYATNVSSSRIDALRYVSSTKFYAGPGTAATPSITFQGDSNTGLYSYSDNNIGFIQNGAVIFRVGSSGIVSYNSFYPSSNNTYDFGVNGIAWRNVFVSSTSYLADINAGGTITPRTTLTYDLGSSSNYWRKLFVKNVSSTNIDALGYVSTTNLYLGGTSISGLYHKQGGNAFGVTSTIGTTDANNLTLITSGSSKLTILNSNGNVGIGTTGPGAKLETSGEIRASRPTIETSQYLSLIADSLGNRILGTTLDGYQKPILFNMDVPNGNANSSNYYAFQIDGSEKVRIDSTGNVGIGTTNPYLFKLTVAGSVAPSTTNSYDLGGTANYWRKLYIKNVSSTNIDALGYVSTTKLWVNGSQVVTANPNLQQVTDQGYFTTRAIGFAGASSTGNIIPTTNAAYDLGSSSLYWRKLFASNVSSSNIDASGYVSSTQFRALNGTAANPSILLENSGTKSGIYSAGDGLVNVTSNGTLTMQFANGGSYIYSNLFPNTDNSKDLGAISSRWRRIYAVNVSSTNIDALGYVSTTRLYLAGSQFVPGNYFVQGGNAFAATGTLGTTDNYNLTFKTNNLNRLTILNNGNVGIGTVNPATKLEITSDSSQLRLSTASSPSGYYTDLVQQYDSNYPFYINVNNKGRILGSKTINGVNTTYVASYYGISFSTFTTDPTAAETRMFISQAGNIGIGTTNPYLYKLTVAGGVAPSSTNSYDLGSAAHTWRSLY